jgi:hypothetical protein
MPLYNPSGADNRIAAGTQTGASTGTVVLSNSNNVTFGMSNSSVVTANAAVNLSAGTTSNLSSAFTFANSNGLSFGLDAGTMTASHNALTSQSNQAFSAGGGSSTFQTLSFRNANGISFSNSLGSVEASYTVPTETPFGISAGTQSVSTGTVVFSNSNGITFGMSGSSRVTASHDGLTSQSNQNVTAANGGFSFQTLSFSNLNGISFGTSAGSAITASHNAITSQSNQQMTLFATGNTTQSSSGTSNASSLIFRGSGVASVGITNGSVLVDVAAGAAAVTQSIGMSTQTAGGATAGTTGYATGDDILYHFVPGSNITMSQSVNGASATLSIYGAAGGGGTTHSGWDPWRPAGRLVAQIGQGSLKIDPVRLEQAVQFDRIVLPVYNTNSSNSSGSHTISFWFGFYTRNVSTLSLLSSTSSTTALTHSGTAGSYSFYSGFRIFTIPFTTTLATGDYWLGFLSRTTSGGANGSYSNWVVSHIGTNFLGHFGSSHATTAQLTLGMGHYSATTSALPASIGFSQIQASGSLAQIRQHLVSFASGTV